MNASGKVVSVDYSTNGGSTFTTYYYLRNLQGDIVKLIDGSGNSVVEYTYDSWGKPLSTTGTLASSLGSNNPFRYRGYVYDTETTLYYLQSRYYNPAMGRFISADVYLSTGQGVLGNNAFAYCNNDPVNLSDDSGHAPRPYAVNMTDGPGGKGKAITYEREKQQLCDNILIVGENEVRFLLMECTEVVDSLISLVGFDVMCEIITDCIFEMYKIDRGMDLSFSRRRVKAEVDDHINGYYSAIGREGYKIPGAFKGYYLYQKIFLGDDTDYIQFVINHCQTIEINKLSLAENIYYLFR